MPFRFIKNLLRSAKYAFISNEKSVEKLDLVINPQNFDNIIVFENNFCWNKIMKQRPQQIAENLPKNTLMFYHSHYEKDFETKDRIRKLKDNLILLDLGIYRKSLTKQLKNHNNKFVMLYSTDLIEMSRIEKYRKDGYEIIYEYVDDINKDLMGKDIYKLLYARHEKLLKLNEVSVICTSNALENKLPCENKLITNGVDFNKFKFRNYDIPEDLKNIRDNFKTLICYYGALASWFDYELIASLAKNDEYAIVLLGIDYDMTLDKSGILNNANVFYLGKKPYDLLPTYGCNMDILIIPFIINDITLATSPVKIFEYMAMKKPIVTTDLPECRKYKSVFVSRNHAEFIDNIKKASELAPNDDYFNIETQEASENDWSRKASAIVDYAVQKKNKRKNLV